MGLRRIILLIVIGIVVAVVVRLQAGAL